MQLPFALALLALPYVIRADTDVRSLQGLTHVTRERTGRKGDASGKYFHESTVSLCFPSVPFPTPDRQLEY
jgi:hypothetical protein